jgi:protein-L-isoaspartate O-methyltransferase
MVELAEIQDGQEVLEPSAGTGRLLDALISSDQTGWSSGKISRLVAVESNYNLAKRLRTTYAVADVREGDFLERNGDLGKFDRILMNPPFENGADIRHIQHAQTFLKPGGKLVAICANGPRQSEKLQPIAATWEELPADTFKDAGTGVRTVLLTINA